MKASKTLLLLKEEEKKRSEKKKGRGRRRRRRQGKGRGGGKRVGLSPNLVFTESIITNSGVVFSWDNGGREGRDYV